MAFGIPSRRGAILLETVLALTLFLMGAVVVGASVQAGLAASQRIAQRGRGMLLAESILAQMKAQYLVAHDGTEGNFLPFFPDYVYRVGIEEAIDIPNLRYVTVTIGWGKDATTVDDTEAANRVQLTAWLYGEEPPPPEEGEETGETETTEEAPAGGGP